MAKKETAEELIERLRKSLSDSVEVQLKLAALLDAPASQPRLETTGLTLVDELKQVQDWLRPLHALHPKPTHLEINLVNSTIARAIEELTPPVPGDAMLVRFCRAYFGPKWSWAEVEYVKERWGRILAAFGPSIDAFDAVSRCIKFAEDLNGGYVTTASDLMREYRDRLMAERITDKEPVVRVVAPIEDGDAIVDAFDNKFIVRRV